ncbi:Hint domain-containing protein [Maritimibacter sp. HL-12]|uniref:Hint domain-containing protein n=1 Tax=Maritimibacter sp. HL-12 TaxID=1162418 RepID=UPI000A0F042F|nr:Hint domain-containing protein [Maritimibacter sp. HL-12]SMH55639.1 Hint domain-containing protein [Maritimibacter sp. HL-12]
MLHFRSPAVENDLPPALDMRAGVLSALGPVSMPEFATSGLAQSSVIETARGSVLARDIRAGDRVVTRDNGMQTLRWVGTSTVIYDEPDAGGTICDHPHRGPVRIRAGALGSNPDAGNLVLAPGQRVLVRNALSNLLFATDEIMASVGDLTHIEGTDIAPRSVGRWVHLLFDQHELIQVNGLWMESFAPDMWSIRVAYPEQWHAITEAMPRLRYDNTAANYVESRPTIDAREARLIDAI